MLLELKAVRLNVIWLNVADTHAIWQKAVITHAYWLNVLVQMSRDKIMSVKPLFGMKILV